MSGSMPRTALLAGATGLVGGECLRRLLEHPAWSNVLVLTRRNVAGHAPSGKLRQIVTDFSRLESAAAQVTAEHVFCALGTTMRKAGSRAAFREVDFEYPLRLARLALGGGARHFSLVSAAGANRRSPVFYSRVKGELEEALIAMGWPSLAIFRPSLIEGERTESRPLEHVSGCLLKFAPPAWRPVPASAIAAAMIAVALERPPGITIVESRRIAQLARGSSSGAP
jgi:uncharacterized protein YbjT (DUF2867 family)